MSKLALFVLLLLLASCDSEPDFPGVGITIKNDIRDASYNVIQIQSSGAVSTSGSLKPGQRMNVPGSGALKFTFSRRYSDHTKIYKVECPARSKRSRLKLIDVHLNRMAGGCKLVYYSGK